MTAMARPTVAGKKKRKASNGKRRGRPPTGKNFDKKTWQRNYMRSYMAGYRKKKKRAAKRARTTARPKQT